jgi:hypothetical protein
MMRRGAVGIDAAISVPGDETLARPPDFET